ncbi:WD repeat-containing protein 60 [Bulinus truncatus]|nr:WD repeat-containing protein 60 [Bulinus truncatus]
MPSENRRPKDDTWTSAELNKALKGSKDDPHHSKKRKEDDGERRHHRDEVNSSDHRREDRKSSKRKEEDEKKSKRHRDRGDSVEKVQLTEEDRERLRQERRLKRGGGGAEEKRHRVKESKPERVVDEDEIRKRRQWDKEEEGKSERRRNQEDESQKHKEDRERERRKYEKEKERARQDEREKERRRHKAEVEDDERNRRHKEVGSSRHHKDGDRHHRSKDESDHHKLKDAEEDERERRRQERREQREREKLQEKSNDKDRERHKDKSRDRDKDRDRDRQRDKDTDRVRSKEKVREKERDTFKDSKKERDKTKEREIGSLRKSESKSFEKDRDHKFYKNENLEDSESNRRSSRQQETKGKKSQQKDEDEDSNPEGGDDDYNYEEDFEDYDDDFEDDNDEDDDEKISPQRGKRGEMEEVLRALDEENNRVASSSSQRSNWSESTDHSDDHSKDHKTGHTEPSKSSKPRTFINFVSAKQRVLDHTVAGKVWKRFEDLSKLIELDVSKFDMFDLPPVKEYDLYIRSFGRSDTKQAYVQTRDDDIDRDIQTDEIENLSKWTQHPSDTDTAVGGEGINVQTTSDRNNASGPTDPEKLNRFLNNVGKFLFTILDEDSKSSSDDEKKKEHKTKVSFSKKAFHLGTSGFFKGHGVVALSFCPLEPNFLLSVHASHFDTSQLPSEQMMKDNTKDSTSVTAQTTKTQLMSFICVWNISQPTYPYRICGSEMRITSACFSPMKATQVFAGMNDGSVALWDLRESGSQKRNIMIDDHDHLVQFPTYNTAQVLESENHHSPVVAIVPLYSHSVGSYKDNSITESKLGLSFQLASIDETAVLNLWVLAEVAAPDTAGSETDLGLAPGGKMKLLRSSSVTIINPNKFLSQELKALDLRFNPLDLNHFYVATDAGCIVHRVRFGSRVYPQFYSSLVDSPVPIVSVDFSPFGQPYFLAACQDGSLQMYHTKIDKPIATWKDFTSGTSIISVRWSQSRPAVFFVLDSSSAVYTFDLVENGLAPVKMDRLTLARVNCIEIASDPNLLSPGGVSRPTYMACATYTGEIELLSFNEEIQLQQPLEEEFLENYVDRF